MPPTTRILWGPQLRLISPSKGTAIAGSAACFANTNGSAFITVVNTTAQTLTYSHCLTGNSGYDLAFGVSLGTGVPAVATKVAYITGSTGSANFPVTANSIPPAGSVANGVAFVSLVNTANGNTAVFHISGRHRQRHGQFYCIRFGGQRLRDRRDWLARLSSYARGSPTCEQQRQRQRLRHGVRFQDQSQRPRHRGSSLFHVLRRADREQHADEFGHRSGNCRLRHKRLRRRLYDSPRHADNLGSVSDSPRSCGRDERVCGRATFHSNHLGFSDDPPVWNSARCDAVTTSICDDHK